MIKYELLLAHDNENLIVCSVAEDFWHHAAEYGEEIERLTSGTRGGGTSRRTGCRCDRLLGGQGRHGPTIRSYYRMPWHMQACFVIKLPCLEIVYKILSVSGHWLRENLKRLTLSATAL